MNKNSSQYHVYVFALPSLIIFTIFVIFPIIPEILISFQHHDGFSTLGWVGLQNYKEVLSSHKFWLANKNTIFIVLMSLFVALPISLIFALVIDKQTQGIREFFKFAAVFPAVLSVTVISQMWIALLDPNWGALNNLLYFLGLGRFATDWLSNKNTVMFWVTFTFLWQYIGLNMILFYAGIKTIPKSYYEAAEIDGASFFKISIKITIPLLREIIKYVVVISTLGSMAMFAYSRIMTNGGPGYASRTIMYEMYYTAFSTSQFGKGCAVAIIFIFECLILNFIINKSFSSEKLEY